MSQEIPITRGRCVIVDDEDYERLSKYRWQAHDNRKQCVYARRSTWSGGKKGHVFMHHEIVGNVAHGLEVDHVNGNTLDNQKSNLRLITRRQNLQNNHKKNKTSQFVGVSWEKDRKKWRSQIAINGKTICLGRSDNEYEEHLKYIKALEFYNLPWNGGHDGLV